MSVAGLALFRVIGSMGFLFLKYLRAIVRYVHKSEGSGSWGLSMSNPFSKKS